MASHPSTLAWKIPWTEDPWGRQEPGKTERLHFHFHVLEQEMATHSSILALKIPWTPERPGGLQFMGSLRVGHD